jgi:hypothetical protein
LLGVIIGHKFLGVAALRGVPADRIAALLRPAFQALEKGTPVSRSPKSG